MNLKQLVSLKPLNKRRLSSRITYKDGKVTRMPECEFHKPKCISSGHWRYLGHDIIRTKEKGIGKVWRSKPPILYDDMGTFLEYEGMNLADMCSEVLTYYIDMCEIVIAIEKERAK